MPITGMTGAKIASTRSGKNVIGRLRKGGEKKKITKQGKNGPYEIEVYGNDLEFFRFTTNNSFVSDRFHKCFGDTPGMGVENAIGFMLSSDDPDDAFPSWMKYYRGSSEYIRCDRDFIHSERVTSPRGGPWENIAGEVVGTGNVGKPSSKWIDYAESKRPACRFPDCAKGKKGMESCATSGILRIVVPSLETYGVVEVLLKAKNDIPTVYAQIIDIQKTVERHGLALSEVPLILWREPRGISAVNFKDASKRQRVDKSLVNVAIAPAFAKLSLTSRQHYAIESARSFGLNGGGDRPQLAPVQTALPSTESWEDEFGRRLDFSFRSSDAWKDVQMGFDSARSLNEVSQAEQSARRLIQSGQLPESARSQISISAEGAAQRIVESGVKPIEADFVEESSVRDRIEAIARLTRHTMQQVSGMAKGLPEDLTTWSEQDVQKLRNRLYADSPVVSGRFDNPDEAIAAFKEFGKTEVYKGCPPSDDGAVWAAWLEHSSF